MGSKTVFFELLLLFLLASVTALFSQDTQLTETDMLSYRDMIEVTPNQDNSIISASRSYKKEEDLPLTAYIISGEEIRKNQYVTLVDVLKSLPGIRVSQPGSGEDGETFLMRGFIGNFYSKILVNNIPIQPSVVSGFPIGAQLPIRQAERIEVIYGPAAAIYGADAANGVINIITQKAEKTSFAQADVGIGEYGYHYGNFVAGGKAGRNKNILTYNIYGSNYHRNDLNILHSDQELYHPLSFLKNNLDVLQFGDQIYEEPQKISDVDLRRENLTVDDLFNLVGLPHYEGNLAGPVMSNFPQSSRMLGVELNFRGIHLAFNDMYRKDHISIGRNTGIFKYNDPTNFWGENIKRIAMSYNTQWGNTIVTTSNLSFLRYRLDNSSSIGRTYGPVERAYQYTASDDVFLEQLFTYAPSGKIEIVGGLSYQLSGNMPKTNDLEQPFDRNDYKAFSTDRLMDPDPVLGYFGYNPLRYHNKAGFVQGFLNLSRFTFMGGIRHDDNSLYGKTTNPRIAMMYQAFPATSFRISAGSAFKAPSPSLAFQSVAFKNEEFGFVSSPDAEGYIYAVIPNPGLKPEIFESYEVGIRSNPHQNVSLDISGYYNRMENVISSIMNTIDKKQYPLAVGDLARQSVNSSSAHSKLFGIQSNLHYKNLIPSWKLDAELNIHYSFGQEIIPFDSSQVDHFRMMPNWIGQLNLSLNPLDPLYIRLENVFMGNWWKRFIPSAEAFQDDYFSTDGYFAMDLISRYYFNDQISTFLKVINVFNTEYAGIEALGLDVDLKYNPQLKRNLQIGLSFEFD